MSESHDLFMAELCCVRAHKGLAHPRRCACSDRKTAALQSSICSTCLLPSALTDSPPGFPLLPVGLRIFACLRGLEAAADETTSRGEFWAKKRGADISSPLGVCLPPTLFIFLSAIAVSFISLSSFLCLFSELLPSSALPLITDHPTFPSLFLHPRWSQLRDAYGSPIPPPTPSFYCLALAIARGW